MSTPQKKLVLPALRGVIGDWVYYSCLMNLKELGERVSFAEEIHPNKSLSQMIQRELKRARSNKIANYIKESDDRFFNSLVIAVYGGDPAWHELSKVTGNLDLNELDEETLASVGFLSLEGGEKLFALDGQHRLAGIKKALADGIDQDPFDDLSAIFVTHNQTAAGLERTRRLFTTLNKTAKAVNKAETITLDEDDVMAICVRKLIEESGVFREQDIAYIASYNIPKQNKVSLTTIGNLYEILKILFKELDLPLSADEKSANFGRVRPSDEDLAVYFQSAVHFFKTLLNTLPDLKAFKESTDPSLIISTGRGGTDGGSVLLRPKGLIFFTKVITRLAKKHGIEGAVVLAKKLPTQLSSVPYLKTMWDDDTKRVITKNDTIVQRLLFYIADVDTAKDRLGLLDRYRDLLGVPDAKLPDKLV